VRDEFFRLSFHTGKLEENSSIVSFLRQQEMSASSFERGYSASLLLALKLFFGVQTLAPLLENR